MHLVENYTHEFRKICVDNWFSSPLLAVKLLQKNTYLLSTAKKSSKFMPNLSSRLSSGQVELHVVNGILIERWKDKRDLIMMNTFMSYEMIHVRTEKPNNSRPEPSTSLTYNNNMGGIDQVDRKPKLTNVKEKVLNGIKKCFFTTWICECTIHFGHGTFFTPTI